MTKRKKVNYNTARTNKEYSKCVSKVGNSVWQKYKYTGPALNKLSVKKRWIPISKSINEFRRNNKKEFEKYDKRWIRTYKKCNKLRSKKMNTLTKSKEKCCKCHYIKNKRGLRKVRGAWGHCSYDMQNCCKDTIIK